jgi:hypothetical protein
MAVFWVTAPCSLVEVYQRFRGPCCLHHQGDRPAYNLNNFITRESIISYHALIPYYQNLKVISRYKSNNNHFYNHQQKFMGTQLYTNNRKTFIKLSCDSTLPQHFTVRIHEYVTKHRIYATSIFCISI